MASPLESEEEWIVSMLEPSTDKEDLAMRLTLVEEKLRSNTSGSDKTPLTKSRFERLVTGCMHHFASDGPATQPSARLLATLVAESHCTRQETRQEFFSVELCSKLTGIAVTCIKTRGIEQGLVCMHTLIAAAKGLTNFAAMMRQPQRRSELVVLIEGVTGLSKRFEAPGASQMIVVLDLFAALCDIHAMGTAESVCEGGSLMTRESLAALWIPVVAKASVAPDASLNRSLNRKAIALLLRVLPEMSSGPPQSVSTWLEEELKEGGALGEEMLTLLATAAESGATGEMVEAAAQTWGVLVYLLGNRMWETNELLNPLLVKAATPLIRGFMSKKGLDSYTMGSITRSYGLVVASFMKCLLAGVLRSDISVDWILKPVHSHHSTTGRPKSSGISDSNPRVRDISYWVWGLVLRGLGSHAWKAPIPKSKLLAERADPDKVVLPLMAAFANEKDPATQRSVEKFMASLVRQQPTSLHNSPNITRADADASNSEQMLRHACDGPLHAHKDSTHGYPTAVRDWFGSLSASIATLELEPFSERRDDKLRQLRDVRSHWIPWLERFDAEGTAVSPRPELEGEREGEENIEVSRPKDKGGLIEVPPPKRQRKEVRFGDDAGPRNAAAGGIRTILDELTSRVETPQGRDFTLDEVLQLSDGAARLLQRITQLAQSLHAPPLPP